MQSFPQTPEKKKKFDIDHVKLKGINLFPTLEERKAFYFI